MEMENVHLSYISNILIKEIAEKLLPNKLLEHDVANAGDLDGFMSALYSINIKVLDVATNKESTKVLLAKFMKGDDNFRVSTKSYIQFANEICIYSKVIPYFSEFLQKHKINQVDVENWIPKVYVAKYGNIDGLSNCFKSSNESVLVLENLKPYGYRGGPRLYLNEHHLNAMTKPLAEYHAMTYALRITNDPILKQLESAVIPLSFVDAVGSKTNLYGVLYRVAFDRFFDYFERTKKDLLKERNSNDSKLEKCMLMLKEKYGQHPTRLLEHIRLMGNEPDVTFSAILHGDFNRNNVLFRYHLSDDIPENAKLIDFQEVRVGSPCIDLSFAMYMNLDRSTRDDCWISVLKNYHLNLSNTLEAVVSKCGIDKRILEEEYSYDAFYDHFKKYAFYGAMVCMHFLPWFVGTEEELQQLSTWFERDMHSEEFYKISFTAGGDDANQRVFEIVKHACDMGYLDFILKI